MAGPVRGNKGTAVGASSMTLALGGSAAAGNLLVASMQTPNTVGGSVSDSINGAYTVGNNHSTGNTSNDLAMWYRENVASGNPTLTFTPGGAGNIGACVEEYSGVVTASSIDKNGATDANGTTITSGSLTNTGANGDLIVASHGSAAQNVTVSNSTAGWSVDQNNTPNATQDAILASRVQAVAAAFTTTFGVTGGAQDQTVVVLSFKLAAVAATGAQAAYAYSSN